MILNNLLYLIICLYCVNAKEVINILINKPAIEEKEYLKKYNEIINQYFLMINDNNINYTLQFSYCTPTPEDGEHLSQFYKDAQSPFSIDEDYAKNFNCTLRELKNSKYDMMILDDRFLYADNSYIDFMILKNEFGFKTLSDYYIDYNTYEIDKSDLSHHDEDILNDGKINSEKSLYGLPYEIDFDLLYYHDSNVKSKDALAIKVQDSSFKDDTFSEETILSAGFKDNDDLLNFFSEFVQYQYNKPKENDPTSYNFLYNEEAIELFNSFRKYIQKLTGKNNMEKVLSTSVEEAYQTFLKDKSKIFRGGASLYKALNENSKVSIKMNSLPEDTTVIQEKYLVINKNSSQSMDTLLKLATILTSKQMQMYRALQMGSIPTFNFKSSNDEVVSSYCQMNREMCEKLKKINPIRIRKIFKKTKFSADFMEAKLIVPIELKKTLLIQEDMSAKKVFMNLLDVWNTSTDKELQISVSMILFIILNFITIIVAIYLVVFMVKVYLNRNHPYVKAMSPHLTNLTIFGILLRIIFPYFYSVVTTRYLCRLSVVLNFFINNIVYIPLFAIIFRIYYIYTNASNMSIGKKLHDKRLIIYIIIILIITFLVYYEVSYFDMFNLETEGSIKFARLLTCVYDFDRHALYSYIYTAFLFVTMLVMTIQVHKLSKKYGDTRFISFIVLLLLSSFLFERGFSNFFSNGASNMTITSIILLFIHMVLSLITVYILIGNRLVYIRKHPIKNKEQLNRKSFSNINDLVNFIPIRGIRESQFSLFKSRSKSGNTFSNFEKNDNQYSMNSDPIIIDHNYHSFAQSINKSTFIEDDNIHNSAILENGSTIYCGNQTINTRNNDFNITDNYFSVNIKDDNTNNGSGYLTNESGTTSISNIGDSHNNIM
jgi:hypothetical protein